MYYFWLLDVQFNIAILLAERRMVRIVTHLSNMPSDIESTSFIPQSMHLVELQTTVVGEFAQSQTEKLFPTCTFFHQFSSAIPFRIMHGIISPPQTVLFIAAKCSSPPPPPPSSIVAVVAAVVLVDRRARLVCGWE